MATSAEILARLRQEQQWQRDNAWQQTPVPAPAPATPTPVRTPAPVQTNRRNLPAPSVTSTPTPMPTRNRQTPTPAAPTVWNVGMDYLRSQNLPSPNNQAFDPYQTPATPRPPSITPTMPRPTSTPQPAATPTPAAQTQYRNPYPTGSMNNPAPTTRPVTQQPANRPMYGPPTQQEATQKNTQGRIMDRGQGFPTTPAEPAPLYNAKEVLLDYLLRTNDPEMLNRLANAAANPIQQDMTLYDAGTENEGYSRMRRGGPGVEEVLNAYASVPAGTPYESIWNQKPAPTNPNRSRRNAILEGGGTRDPVLDYLLRTGDPQTIARLQSSPWGRSILARYEQLNQG